MSERASGLVLGFAAGELLRRASRAVAIRRFADAASASDAGTAESWARLAFFWTYRL
jgi:hypothetical protein